MGKVTKIVANIVAGIILGVGGLLLTVMLLLDVGVFQNRLASAASSFASEFLNTKVSLSYINLTGYNRLSAQDFYVEDFAGDTLLYVRKADVRIDLLSLIEGDIVLEDVRADDAKLLLHDDGSGKINIAQITDLLKPEKVSRNPKPIELRNLQLTNSEFRLVNDNRPPIGEGMIDWGDMDFDHLNANATHLIILGNRIEMALHNISFVDRTGAVITNLSVEEFVIDSGLLEFTDSHIELPHTDLRLPLIKLSSKTGWASWKSFVDSVKMDIRIVESTAGAEDLKYFVPIVQSGQDFTLRSVTANFVGTTNDFWGTIDNVEVYNSRLGGRYHISNVVSKPMRFDGEISRLVTSALDIEKLARQFGVPEIPAQQASMLSRLGAIAMDVKAGGTLEDFNVAVKANTDLGNLSAQTQVVQRNGSIDFYNAVASSDGFDVGFLTRTKELGKVSFAAAGDMSNFAANVLSAEYNGYTYHDVSVEGSYSDNIISADIVSRDTAAMFAFKGSYDMRNKPQYSVDGSIERLDLSVLGINKRDSVSVFSGYLTVSGEGISTDDLELSAKIDSIRYAHKGGAYRTGAIDISAYNDTTRHSFTLTSDFLTADYISSADYGSSFGYLADVFYAFIPELSDDEGVAVDNVQNVKMVSVSENTPSHIELHIVDINPVLGLIVPGLSIGKGSRVMLDYDPLERNVDLLVTSNNVEWNAGTGKEPVSISSFSLEGKSRGRADSLHLVLNSGKASLGGVRLKKTRGDISVLDNRAAFHLSASSDLMSMSTNLNGLVDLGRTEDKKLTIKGLIAPSEFSINGQNWTLSSGQVDYFADRIEIDSLSINSCSGSGRLYVDGGLSIEGRDTLDIDITNLNIAPIAALLRIDELSARGMLNGKAEVYSFNGSLLAEANVGSDNVSINGYDIVPLTLRLNSDVSENRNLLRIASRDGGTDFVRGYLSSDGSRYRIRGGIHGIPAGIVQPFLAGAITDSEGEVDIDFDVTKQENATPSIAGKLSLNDISTLVAFNNIRYALPKAELVVENNIATLSGATITDSNNKTAKITARADLRNLSNITYSAHLQADNFYVLNTTFAQNPTFYGKLFVTGNVDMSGDARGMHIDAVAETGDGSSFYLPMTSSGGVIDSDFVIFESLNKPLLSEDDESSGNRKTDYMTSVKPNIDVELTMTINPNTEVNLVLDPETNDGIRAVGDALLSLRFAPRNDLFTLTGTYEILEGDYTFNVQNIASRKFAIEHGSTIRWGGEPLDPQLDIRAIYTLRTSLSPLRDLIGEDDLHSRIPVDCIVNIGGRLSGPDIKPDIKVRVTDQMVAVVDNAAERPLGQAQIAPFFQHTLQKGDGIKR